VNVYHAAEVNLVLDAMAGKASVTNDVLPRTHCDLYSYSAYETSIDGSHFRAALNYIATRAPDSRAFGAHNVYVGEFGVPENERGAAYARASLRRTIDDALAWGCPYVVYWQVYDNECKTRATADPRACRGFWLVKPDGSRGAAWDVLVGYLKERGQARPLTARGGTRAPRSPGR
jgi:hypothetical protein